MKKSDMDEFLRDDDLLAEIFVDVTPRRKPKPEAEEQAFATLYAQWRDLANRRKKRYQMMSWSIAASLLLAIGALYTWIGVSPVPNPDPVANVARIGGKPAYVNDSIIGAATGDIPVIHVGDTIRTGPDSRVSLAWNSGGSLRIDQDSEIRFVSPDAVRLVSGSLYFDSLPYDRKDEEPPLFSVETVAGRLSHVGTQFMATVKGEDVSLGVREGQVLVDGPKFKFLAQPGDRLIINADGMREKQLVEAYDQSWRWAEDIAPAFSPAGRTVLEMVTWISRETGRPFHFRSTSAEVNAAETKLVGLDDVSPGQALRTMPFATDLRFEIVNDEIVIRLEGEQR